jgi:hypothetical protein
MKSTYSYPNHSKQTLAHPGTSLELGVGHVSFAGQSRTDDPAAVLVDAATFSELLISKRELQRSDSPSFNLLGLYDARSGVRYVITESDLYRATP